jgi:hypothetical protein
MNNLKTIDEKMKSEKELLQRKRAASPNKLVMMREERTICKLRGKRICLPPRIEPGRIIEHRAPVDIQDKGAVIGRFPGHAPELKWNK